MRDKRRERVISTEKLWASAGETSAEPGVADRFSTTTPCIYVGVRTQRAIRMAPAVEDNGNEDDEIREASELDVNGASAPKLEEEEDDEEEEEEEPRLEYTSITKKLTAVYRNGDATSTFLVAGDKMVSFIDRVEGSTIAPNKKAEIIADRRHP